MNSFSLNNHYLSAKVTLLLDFNLLLTNTLDSNGEIIKTISKSAAIVFKYKLNDEKFMEL